MNAPHEVKSNSLASALVRAQRGFAPALKSSLNPHFKSKYVDLAGCVEAVIDSLNSSGIALIQQTHECTDGVIVETLFLHESGESMSCGKLHVPASKNDAQGYGSALTYARRYSLMAACGIAPEDDDGNAASKGNKAAIKPANGTITPTTGAWDAMDADEQAFLTEVAMEVIAILDEGKPDEAMKFLDSKHLQAEEKVAIWTRFDSKQRAAMKKAGEAMKKKPTPEDFANTP